MKVHLFRLSSGGTEFICQCEGLFSHPNEIWDLCSFSPPSYPLVKRMEQRYGRFLSYMANLLVNFCILWRPSGRHDELISIVEESIFLWSLDCSKKNAQVQSKESAGMLHYLSGGAWDPHDVNAIAATTTSSVKFWDLRTMKKTNSIDRAHVRSVDYDIKNRHKLVTAEDESGTSLWDLRMLKVPIQELPGHAHWY